MPIRRPRRSPRTWSPILFAVALAFTAPPAVHADVGTAPHARVDFNLTLEFIHRPHAAEVDRGITGTPLDPEGPPIQVRVKSHSGQTATGWDGEVTLAIEHVPPGGTSKLDGTTTVEVVDGVATFCDPEQTHHCELPSIGAHGRGYTLSATAGHHGESATSEPFDVVDDGVVCAHYGRCRVYARFQETASAVNVLGVPGDLLAVSIGVDLLHCTGYTNTSEVVTAGSTADSVMAVRLTFQEYPASPRTDEYHVCFSSTLSFVDRYGNVVPPGGSGILADCSMTVPAPCTVSRTVNEMTGYVTLKLLAPPGDPKFVG